MAPVKRASDVWWWFDTCDHVTQEHVNYVYRLTSLDDLPPCYPGSCRRNCSLKPFCLNSLGENLKYNIQLPYEWRKENKFVGLRNLGATCYVNSIIQVLFYIPYIRRAVYMWRDEGEINGELDNWQPKSDMAHLQCLFALLEKSNRRYIDPTPFITCLGLNTSLQQDAEEFCHLIIQLLIKRLSESRESHIADSLRRQVTGVYTYVTRCETCNSVSKKSSEFTALQLNIQNHSVLEDCIQHFFKEEKLEGENQYFCEMCGKLCDAIRSISLEHIPDVLCLQVMRFVFDRKTGFKRKISNCLKFPDTLPLSLSSVKSVAPSTNVYQLSAVLSHLGHSTYSGHYIAQIRNPEDDNWLHFNDEEVKKVTRSNLDFAIEKPNCREEMSSPENAESSSRKRTKKLSYKSKNCYMLVYSKRVAPMGDIIPRIKAMKHSPCKTYTNLVIKQSFATSPKNDSIKSINNLSVSQGCDFNATNFKFVCSADCIRKPQREVGCANSSISDSSVVRTDETLGSSDLEQPDACKNRMKDDVKDDKSPNLLKYTADSLLPDYVTEFVDHHNSQSSDVTRKCDQLQAKVQEIKEKMWTDEKSDFYWISKAWLRLWFVDPQNAIPIDNSDVLCSHGRLSYLKITRVKAVSTVTGKYFYEEFGGGPCLTRESVCWDCVQKTHKELKVKKLLNDVDKTIKKHLANNVESDVASYWVGKKSLLQWKRLAALSLDKQLTSTEPPDVSESDSSNQAVESDKFNNDIICAHGSLHPDVTSRRLITKDAWLLLKQYFCDCPTFESDFVSCQLCKIKDSVYEENMKEIAKLQQKRLSKLYTDKQRCLSLKKNISKFFIVSSDFINKWKKFIRNPCNNEVVTRVVNKSMICDHGGSLYTCEDLIDPSNTICVHVTPEDWTSLQDMFVIDHSMYVTCICNDDGTRSYELTPDICFDCMQARIHSERFIYNNVPLYIRDLASEESQLSKITGQTTTEHGDSQSESNGATINCQWSETMMSRRSGRIRKIRGEQNIVASSSDSLLDMKIKVMALFDVMPSDQNLYYQGKLLDGPSTTLEEFEITPYSVISLKRNDSSDSQDIVDEAVKESRSIEQGFSGTNLMKL